VRLRVHGDLLADEILQRLDSRSLGGDDTFGPVPGAGSANEKSGRSRPLLRPPRSGLTAPPEALMLPAFIASRLALNAAAPGTHSNLAFTAASGASKVWFFFAQAAHLGCRDRQTDRHGLILGTGPDVAPVSCDAAVAAGLLLLPQAASSNVDAASTATATRVTRSSGRHGLELLTGVRRGARYAVERE